jgi:hypothetical protein
LSILKPYRLVLSWHFELMCNIISPIGSGNELNMYLNPRVHSSIPTEGKNSTREEVKKIMRWQCRGRLRWGPSCYTFGTKWWWKNDFLHLQNIRLLWTSFIFLVEKYNSLVLWYKSQPLYHLFNLSSHYLFVFWFLWIMLIQ